jgi:hypothetical protein
MLIGALLGPLAVWGVQVVWLGPADPMVGELTWPAVTTLFAATLAAEVDCSGFGSGTSDSLGRLPARGPCAGTCRHRDGRGCDALLDSAPQTRLRARWTPRLVLEIDSLPGNSGG